MKRPARLTATVMLLVVAGLLSRFMFSFDRYPDVIWLSIFFGLLIAQATLLGLWGGFSGLSIEKRVAGVVIGTFYLWSLLTGEVWSDMRVEPAAATLVMFYFPTLSVMLSATWVRKRKASLQFFSDRRFPELSDTLQFGIGQIMVATGVTAVLVTLAKGVRAFYFEGHPSGFWACVVFAIWLALAYPLTAIISLWATLGLNHPMWRLGFLAIVALAVAFLPLTFVPLDNSGTTIYVSSCLLQTGFVAVVLLVARSAGYRLISLRQDPYGAMGTAALVRSPPENPAGGSTP